MYSLPQKIGHGASGHRDDPDNVPGTDAVRAAVLVGLWCTHATQRRVTILRAPLFCRLTVGICHVIPTKSGLGIRSDNQPTLQVQSPSHLQSPVIRSVLQKTFSSSANQKKIYSAHAVLFVVRRDAISPRDLWMILQRTTMSSSRAVVDMRVETGLLGGCDRGMCRATAPVQSPSSLLEKQSPAQSTCFLPPSSPPQTVRPAAYKAA
ncbi:unnamed protein product [Cutaneotrichosporon oleaginosum]